MSALTKEDLTSAVKEVMLSQTIASGDHAAEIAEISANVKHIVKDMDDGKKHFEKIDDCMVELTKKSSEQKTDISLLQQEQKNNKDSRKSTFAVIVAFGSVVANVIWNFIKGE